MSVCVNLYSNNKNEIYNFLKRYRKNEQIDKSALEWSMEYNNPIEIADIIGIFIDNNDIYKINMWISLDENFYINVTNNNANKIIRYLFERYPY